jgi:hypothetical protein
MVSDQAVRCRGKVLDLYLVILPGGGVKVKVKLSLCLTKHNTMKTYW